MDDHCEIEVCFDCVMLIANAEGTDEVAQAIADNWPHTEWHLALGDTDDETTFSWRRCEGCGSTLGGSRHAAVALPVTNHSTATIVPIRQEVSR